MQTKNPPLGGFSIYSPVVQWPTFAKATAGECATHYCFVVKGGTNIFPCSSVVERHAVNVDVVGSNPAGGAKPLIRAVFLFWLVLL